MKLTNLEFLNKHSYSTEGMSEADAKAFIIEQSKMNMAYKYIIKRARQIIKTDNRDSDKNQTN